MPPAGIFIACRSLARVMHAVALEQQVALPTLQLGSLQAPCQSGPAYVKWRLGGKIAATARAGDALSCFCSS